MSNEIQIEVTIPGGFIHQGVKYSQGDVSTEDYAVGKYFIDAGWARDTSGILPSVEVSKATTVLFVDNVDSNVGVV